MKAYTSEGQLWKGDAECSAQWCPEQIMQLPNVLSAGREHDR